MIETGGSPDGYNRIRLFSFFLMVSLYTILTMSCNKDDTTVNFQNGKRIAKLTVVNEGGRVEVPFFYANGRLVKIGDYSIVYSGKQVTLKERFENGVRFDYILQLNNDGYVESGIMNRTNLEDNYTIACEYSNGYMTKFKYNCDGGEGTLKIEYDGDNNLKTINSSVSYSWGTANTEYKFTPAVYPYIGKDFWFLIHCDGGCDLKDYLLPAYYAGLLGKNPKNHIAKFERTSAGFVETYNFNYTFDSEGYVLKTTISPYRDESSYWKTYEFTYEN